MENVDPGQQPAMTPRSRARHEWWRGFAERDGPTPRHPEPFPESRQASYPPPYPDGWYRIAASADLNRGQVKYIDRAGRQIALFRSDSDGRIHALEAFCPHMGANLADGRVIRGQLRCPFHGWCLDGSGKITNIPYTRAKPSVRHPHYEVVDYYGMVFVYISADGPRAAPYRLPAQPSIDSGRMVFRGERFMGEVDMHIIELAENAADLQHFHELHGNLRIPWTQVALPYCKLLHEISVGASSDLAHVYSFRNDAHIEVLGRRLKKAGATVDVTYHGPATLMQFDFRLHSGGCLTMFQTCTPVGPMKQRVRFRWFADRKIPRLLALWVVGGWASQFQEDVAIWKRKVYRQLPILARGDGPVRELRRWYSQFYGNHARD